LSNNKNKKKKQNRSCQDNNQQETVDHTIENDTQETEDNKPINEELFIYEEKDYYKVVAVCFKNVGKKYFFDPRELNLVIGDKVLVETIRGIEFGEVVSSIKEVTKDEVFLPIKPILRQANEEDMAKYNKNKDEEPHVIQVCNDLIKRNDLHMRLLGCEYTFDRTKLIIYFSAENRIDFRQLVKDLASVFRTRIELRQVGVRDAAKYVGGLGPCGRILCCSTFLGNFDTVSIKMAKNQNLSLNPQKISGACGKLLCCLKYEADFYDEMASIMPKVGEIIVTPDGDGRVIGVNALIETVKVTTLENKALKTYQLSDIKRTSPINEDSDFVDAELKMLEE
jgi:cell fate regulator YaaT (PSP1 superfamily)